MTERTPYDLLVGRLGELHARAVDRAPPPEEQRLARVAQRARELSEARSQTHGVVRRVNRALLPLAAVVVCLSLLAYGVRWREPNRVLVAPDPSIVTRASAASARVDLKLPDPCSRRVGAAGAQPLIDDFEDANPLVGSLEHRVGLWSLFSDNVALGLNPPLTPEIRPQATRTNRYALHAQGPELRDWGAVVQVSFQPTCYDASVYAGILFSAKGPGRLYVGIREVRVVPVKWGGTCQDNCYDAHQKKIELSSQWHTYSVMWSELHQRGYDTPPLDPTRINSIGFLIQPGDTPFDLWLDDIKFIARSR